VRCERTFGHPWLIYRSIQPYTCPSFLEEIHSCRRMASAASDSLVAVSDTAAHAAGRHSG